MDLQVTAFIPQYDHLAKVRRVAMRNAKKGKANMP